MGCVLCGRSMRTTYKGDGIRIYRGDYCYKCGKIAINAKVKT